MPTTWTTASPDSATWARAEPTVFALLAESGDFLTTESDETILVTWSGDIWSGQSVAQTTWTMT